jgi:hypothetical protein
VKYLIYRVGAHKVNQKFLKEAALGFVEADSIQEAKNKALAKKEWTFLEGQECEPREESLVEPRVWKMMSDWSLI